ncbi:hypothetical protein Fmac_025399 [Flemingia macrophylla]|uniref:Uncharacterized protein n=1 Tax=Flemingia macrophylla TaxID=520843 RepID=A0ABD1LS39_9FABA
MILDNRYSTKTLVTTLCLLWQNEEFQVSISDLAKTPLVAVTASKQKKEEEMLRKLLHDSPDTVDKIQELLSEKEVPLNAENNNLDNPIRDKTATDEDKNHNLPFPQSKPPEVLFPERGNTEVATSKAMMKARVKHSRRD